MRAIDLYQERADPRAVAETTIVAVECFAPPERLFGLVTAALDGLDDTDPVLRAKLLCVRGGTLEPPGAR